MNGAANGDAAEQYDYDLVTIGAGSGGVRASRVAAGTYGAKVAIIEKPFGLIASDAVGGAGGTCVIRGCVPKKLAVYASEFAEALADARGFGWAVPPAPPPHDTAAFIARKNEEVKRLSGIYDNILKGAGVERLEGRGVVLGPHAVEVRSADGGVRTLRARHILLATGGHAVRPDIPGAELGMVSDDALCFDGARPGRAVCVVGGGYIGLEFASIFRGLGADVQLLFRAPLPLRGFDDECRAVVAENLAARGIAVRPGCTPTRLARRPDGRLEVAYVEAGPESNGVERTLVADAVLFATGRRPSTAGLGLEGAGVALHPKTRAVLVDEHSRTSVPSIWAIGDVADRIALTPVALMEGRALAATLFGGGAPRAPDYENVPSAVFTQPPLATVGLTEEQAVERMDGDLDVYVSRFRPMKNTLSGRQERTFMKMIVHAGSGRVLGCHQVGPDAAEIMQGVAVALKAGATKAHFDACVGIHPSAAEEWVTMSAPARRVRGRGAEPPGSPRARAGVADCAEGRKA